MDNNQPIIKSILDGDLYKISMMKAVLFGRNLGIPYADIQVKYQFINRGNTIFPPNFDKALSHQIDAMEDLRLTDSEYQFLADNCPYLNQAFLDYLKGYRFNSSEIFIKQVDGRLDITIQGPWNRTILWEVSLMALISELHFQMTNQKPDHEWKNRLAEKARLVEESGILLCDFGTRRRFSYDVQKHVVETFNQNCDTFVGSSNVHLSHLLNLRPKGTYAHEWVQVHAALFGYKMANHYAMQAWMNEFDGDLGIALPDTLTLPVFLNNFGNIFAKLFNGVRIYIAISARLIRSHWYISNSIFTV